MVYWRLVDIETIREISKCPSISVHWFALIQLDFQREIKVEKEIEIKRFHLVQYQLSIEEIDCSSFPSTSSLDSATENPIDTLPYFRYSSESSLSLCTWPRSNQQEECSVLCTFEFLFLVIPNVFSSSFSNIIVFNGMRSPMINFIRSMKMIDCYHGEEIFKIMSKKISTIRWETK